MIPNHHEILGSMIRGDFHLVNMIHDDCLPLGTDINHYAG